VQHKYIIDDVPSITIEKLNQYSGPELSDLCDATEATMSDTKGFTIGFSHWETPHRNLIEDYFRGILLVPERQLIIGRLDGVIAGSIQLVKPNLNNQTTSFAASVDNHFVAPWARGYGIAKGLLMAAEEEATTHHCSVIKLSVRETRDAAIKLYETSGYKRWGTLDKYEMVGNQMIAGYFYYKALT
jgi:ribosomal protein S18 acetylase RimI-like enzyme